MPTFRPGCAGLVQGIAQRQQPLGNIFGCIVWRQPLFHALSSPGPYIFTRSQGPRPFLFLLLRLLSNIQEGLYWNNNSILSLAEKIWRGEFIELHELLPSRLTTPEPTVLDLLSSREKSTPKKTISTIKEWATCFNTYISLIYGFANQHMFQIFWLTHRSSWELAASMWMHHGSATMLNSAEATTRPGTPWAVIDSSIWTLHFSRATPVPKSEVKTNAGVMYNQPAWKHTKPNSASRFHPYKPPVCLKWNQHNGCDLQECSYQHVCIQCRSPLHNQLSCPRNTNQAVGKGYWDKKLFCPSTST